MLRDILLILIQINGLHSCNQIIVILLNLVNDNPLLPHPCLQVLCLSILVQQL